MRNGEDSNSEALVTVNFDVCIAAHKRKLHCTVLHKEASGPHSIKELLPLVLFLNGFQLRKSYYSDYTEALARAGYATLQYDAPRLTIDTDEAELSWLSDVLEAARATADLAAVIDFSRLATAGHSRGGKLAALHLVRRPAVATCFLVDPVNESATTSGRPGYPSAVEELRQMKHPRPFGITACDITGPCNPAEGNFARFWSVAHPASWLTVIRHSGHMQFCGHVPWWLAPILGCTCGKGSHSAAQTIELTVPVMLAWMREHFPPAQRAQEAYHSRLFRWLEERVEAGDIEAAPGLDAKENARPGIAIKPGVGAGMPMAV